MPGKSVLFNELMYLVGKSSIISKLKFYLYTSSLIQDKFILIFITRSIDFCLSVSLSKPLLNIKNKFSRSCSGTQKILWPFVGAKILIMTYWQIKFKITKYKALYQILLTLFVIYLRLSEMVFAVLAIVNPNNQKSKIEAWVQTRLR